MAFGGLFVCPFTTMHLRFACLTQVVILAKTQPKVVLLGMHLIAVAHNLLGLSVVHRAAGVAGAVPVCVACEQGAAGGRHEVLDWELRARVYG